MRKNGEYSQELIDRARAVFVSSTWSYEELARQSKALLGQEIPAWRLKDYGRHDPRGDWTVARNESGQAGMTTVSDEVEHVRQILYKQIVMSVEGGVFIKGNVDIDDVKLALSGGKVLNVEDVIAIRPAALKADLVNAYMNLLQKGNFNIQPGQASGKTTLEQAMEMYAEVKQAHTE